MNTFARALLVMLLPACTFEWTAGGFPVDHLRERRICSTLPEDQRLAVYEAVAEWNTALNGWIPLVISDTDCDTTLIEVPKTTEGTWVGLEANNGATIRLRQGDYERATTIIVSHELGHVFGAQHLAHTLMDPALEAISRSCPDGPTMAQVAGYYRIPLVWLKWCY